MAESSIAGGSFELLFPAQPVRMGEIVGINHMGKRAQSDTQ
jgi:hypothetical protein